MTSLSRLVLAADISVIMDENVQRTDKKFNLIAFMTFWDIFIDSLCLKGNLCNYLTFKMFEIIITSCFITEKGYKVMIYQVKYSNTTER